MASARNTKQRRTTRYTAAEMRNGSHEIRSRALKSFGRVELRYLKDKIRLFTSLFEPSAPSVKKKGKEKTQ